MNIKKFVLFIMLIFLILISCSKSTEPDKHSSNITGYVYDVNGIPVPDVAILPKYYLELSDSLIKKMNYSKGIIDSIDPEWPPWETQLYGNCPNPFSIATTIMFYVAEYGDSALWIEDFTRTDTICTFDIYLSHTGFYACLWDVRYDDGLYVENGAYWIYLRVGETVDSIEIFCSRDYDISTNYHNYNCKTFTNEEGKFFISQCDMPFEYYIRHMDSEGNLLDSLYVTRYMKFWAFSDYHTPVFLDSVYVDPDTGANLELQFED